MKRLSLFAAVLFAAVMSFAQAPAIMFSEAASTGALTDSTFTATNLTLRTVDTGNKMSIDANNASFGESADARVPFSYRLKAGAKTTMSDSEPTTNYLKLNAAVAGQLVIAVRPSSSGAEDRNLIVAQNGVELYNQVILESALKHTEDGVTYFNFVKVNVEAGEIILTYPVGALNFYYFGLMTNSAAFVEKLWSGEPLGWTAADSRQWTGFGEYVYWESKAEHTIYGTHDGVTVDTLFTNDAIDGTAFCVDGAGNFVVEGVFPSVASHVFLVKHDLSASVDIPVTGLARTDIVTATGDVFSAEGGYVFLYGNSANLLILAIKNAGAADQEVVTKTVAVAGSNVQNFVVAGDTLVQYVQRRSQGQTGFDKLENGVNTGSIAGMRGYKHTTLGGAMLTLAGNEFAIYPAGANNYSSEFSVANLTEGSLAASKADALQTLFCANTTTRANSTNVGVFLNASKIDDNTAYIQVGNGSDGTALFKLSVEPAVLSACYLKQGNEGATWEATGTAQGTHYVREGIFMADSLFINTTASDEGAVMFTRDNIAFTGNVAVNDTVRFVYNAASGVMGVELLGKFIPKLTFNVKVPEGTPNCYIAGNFNDWTFTRMTQLTDSTYTITITGDGVAIVDSVQYKYTCGTDWAYVEKDANNEEIGNRHWAENDVVARWFDVPSVNAVTYELNGGVFNDYGWTGKGAVLLDLQNDFNAAYNTSMNWVKVEDGVYYYHIGNTTDETPQPIWKTEAEAVGEACTVTGFVQNTTYNTENRLKNLISVTNVDKYGWLKDVIVKTRTAAGLAATDDDLSENIYRKEISAIFLQSPAETSWPAAPSYAIAGTIEAMMPVWKHGFCNPDHVNAEFTLNAPYYSGYTFDGWYAESDFSGSKVTSINDSTPACTLYAKWVEYIPTVAEAIAEAQNDTVKLGAVVTFIRGAKNVYVQDATGGVLLYTAANATCKVGDFVVVRGKNTTYGGAPEIGGATFLSSEEGHALPAELTTTLSALTAEPLKYFAQRVYVEGLVLASYDNNGNAFVTDGVDTVQCYYVTPDQTAIPVGSKVNIHLIAAYYNKFQFVGPSDGIELAPTAGGDPYQYPALGENGVYTLTNKWLYSNVMDNFSANKPAADDYARGMVAKDGKMYFINRTIGGFTVVDGATGEMLDPITITGDHLFQQQDTAGEWSACATLAYNDVKLDNAGHFLIAGCVTGGNRFQVYTVDIATGVATELINERLYDNEEWGAELAEAATKWRFDAFNVYGDVTSNAIVMAADANSFYAYKWTIENGVAGAAERINCTPETTDESLLVKDGALSVTAFGTAPQIFPVDFNYFYVDGFNHLPMLFDMDGTLMEDFATCPTGVAVPMAGDTCTMNFGHNGLCEFQIGDEYFLVMAATNTVGSPTSAFAIYKFADEAKSFADMEPLYFFPKAGMGSATNGCRTAVPSVEVSGTKATIYIYTNNNGYGVYEMTGKEGTGIKNIDGDNVEVMKVIENGHVYIIKNGVRYTVLGAQVSK